jgi:hypothetical protein
VILPVPHVIAVPRVVLSKLARGFVHMVAILGRWVFLGKSDIVPADLAAAAAVRGGLHSSSAIPTWYESGRVELCT